MRISVVIPTLNESDQIADTIASVPTDEDVEILVADGNSDDDTAAVATASGAQVIAAPRGRGPQMNAGAREATGQVLLFLHADTRLPFNALITIRRVLSQRPRVVGGAFRFRTDRRGLFYWFSRVGVNLRSILLRLPFGDQAIFVRRADFEALDGYLDLKACEDLDLVRRLKKRGRVAILRPFATTSARKWEEHGRLRVYWHHVKTFTKYYAGRL